MKRLESVKRVVVLWLSLVGLLFQAAVYAYLWFEYYYPIINNFNRGLKFESNGNILTVGLYVVLLMFFKNTYGGIKVGYQKTADEIYSQ